MVASAVYPQTPSITARFDGEGIGVIYNPDPKRFSGPLILSAPDPKSQGTDVSKLETLQVCLSTGTQFVEFDKWEKIEAFEGNKVLLERLKRRRVLTVLRPDIPEDALPTCTTRDFVDDEDALQLIENSFHLEWLQACFNQETQRPRVRQACGSRLQEVRQLIAAKKLPENIFRG